MTDPDKRDHGGGLDCAIKRFGGTRDGWLDLSTGINPNPYPLPRITAADWADLPDTEAQTVLLTAARNFWQVPQAATVLAAPGASALIARLPLLLPAGTVRIDGPTYNEHAGAFQQAGWTLARARAIARVIVHPNNPDGQVWDGSDERPGDRQLLVIDESFCDVDPTISHVDMAVKPGVIILKSFGKFWGLAGARLGFAIGTPETLANLGAMLGPWPVSGPALRVGSVALNDTEWAMDTRKNLTTAAARLDATMQTAGIENIGGTTLFRLYQTKHAKTLQEYLAKHQIWSRIFPYSGTWLRLGLPGTPAGWAKLETAVAGFA